MDKKIFLKHIRTWRKNGTQRRIDLEADPGETKNLAYQVAYRDIVLEHQALLLRVIKDTLDPFPMSKQMMP